MNIISGNKEESQSKLYGLPDGWVWITLEDVSNISDRDHTTPKYEDSGYPLISPKIFTDYGIDISKAKYVGDKEYSAFEKKCNPEKGDLLYSRIGTIGEVRLLDFDYKFVALHSIALIKPNYGFTCSKYLLYLMQSLNIKHQAIGNVQSVGVPDLGLKRMKNFSIPLPPLAEQHRIVEKLEEEFTRLDAGVSALKRAKALIPRYRQSVLKSAMCGDLTKEWRALHPDVESAEVLFNEIIAKKDKNIDINQSNKANIPDKWICTQINSIYSTKGGGTPSTKIAEYWDGDIPWITSADISEFHRITPRKKVTIIGIQNSATNLVPKDSIIVVTRVGLGKIALSEYELCFSQDCQALIAHHNLIYPKYGLLYLSKEVQSFKYNNRGTTISGVTTKQLKDLQFLLPPLEEQHEIVSEIERRFSIIDEMERVVDESLLKAERLRQSVLKCAFEGRLVPQNPDDEPAGVLLERIRAEKEMWAAEGKAEKTAAKIKKSAGKKKAKKAEAE